MYDKAISFQIKRHAQLNVANVYIWAAGIATYPRALYLTLSPRSPAKNLMYYPGLVVRPCCTRTVLVRRVPEQHARASAYATMPVRAGLCVFRIRGTYAGVCCSAGLQLSAWAVTVAPAAANPGPETASALDMTHASSPTPRVRAMTGHCGDPNSIAFHLLAGGKTLSEGLQSHAPFTFANAGVCRIVYHNTGIFRHFSALILILVLDRYDEI